MLIVLSGVETTHKIFLARQILASLPNFPLSHNYTMSFKSHPFEIYDPSGKLVYSLEEGKITNEVMMDLDNDGIDDPIGMEVFYEARSLYFEIMIHDIKSNHHKSIFSDPFYDLGFNEKVNAPIDEYIDFGSKSPHQYSDVLNNYNNRKLDTQIITGFFGKYFIDRIKKDLGQENVKVYNIIRNPSVCFLLHEKDEEHYSRENVPDRVMDRKKLERSIINAMVIKDIPGVNTIRYEDILTTGNFLFEGQNIVPPKTMLEDDNGYLTTWELDTHIPKKIVNEQDVIEFNNHFQSYEPGYWQLKSDGLDMEYIRILDFKPNGDRIPPDFFKNVFEKIERDFPKNIFNELGYTPLTYDEMTKPI